MTQTANVMIYKNVSLLRRGAIDHHVDVIKLNKYVILIDKPNALVLLPEYYGYEINLHECDKCHFLTYNEYYCDVELKGFFYLVDRFCKIMSGSRLRCLTSVDSGFSLYTSLNIKFRLCQK